MIVDKKLISQDYQKIIKEWLLDTEVLDKSKETYEEGLRRYIDFLTKSKTVSTRATVIDFKNTMMREHSNSTAYIYLAGVKSFYKYLSRTYNIPDITSDIKLPKIPKGFKKDCLTVEQVCKLFDSLEDTTLVKARDKAMINLFVRCGLRCCELIQTNIEDISTRDGQKVLYIRGKRHTEKDEFVVLTNDMLDILDKYLIMRKDYIDKSPLFVSFSNRTYGKRIDSSTVRMITKLYLKNIGINTPRISCHSFRYTSITFSILAGSNLVDVKDFARHADINTSLRYIHNLKRLENALELKIDEFLKNNSKEKRNEIID